MSLLFPPLRATAELQDLALSLSAMAGPATVDLPDLPPIDMVRGIIAVIPVRGIIDPILALGIIEATVARGFIAASLFLPTAVPGGAGTAKDGPCGLG